jgi:hypothetical protein
MEWERERVAAIAVEKKRCAVDELAAAMRMRNDRRALFYSLLRNSVCGPMARAASRIRRGTDVR